MSPNTSVTFALDPKFVATYATRTPPFGFNGLGELVYLRCVTEDTPVLCGDFQWRPAGSLGIGDTVVGFDEQISEDTKERYFRPAIVTDNHIEEAECLGIELDDGTFLYATPDHPWLAKVNGTFQWTATKNLGPGPRGASVRLPQYFTPWKQDESYEAGYLAAAFDGEGSLDGTSGPVFVQLDNAMLDRVRRYLTDKGFQFSVQEKKNYSEWSKKSCYALRVLGGKLEMMRFLGMTGCARLLPAYWERLSEVSLRCRDTEQPSLREVIRVFPAGTKRIAVLSTSTGTHLTGGFASHNTYSRLKEDGTKELWHDTVERVVNGTYTMQKRWILDHNLGWSERKAQRSAQEMYDRIWNMKFLPPGRGLWAMGSGLTLEKDLFAALNNCAFVSTDQLHKDLAEPFTFLMDASMLGIGVGFDTKGAGKLTIQAPQDAVEFYTIPDTREGWVESVGKLLLSYFEGTSRVVMDYSLIRPAGQPIKGFGGVSSGHEPLERLHESLRNVLNAQVGQPISVTTIVDIMNLIGKCVVAGNIRRTAEIVFGAPDSEEFLDLKDYKKNPHREAFGWTSNNSIFATTGMDYTAAATRTAENGEPGYAWLENMRAYGRMGDAPDFKDKRVSGGNPCLEQSLESYELCCLVETFPANHESLDDFKRTLKFAYLYAKTVTLGKTPWTRTNRVLLRNRRIGLSMSGIQQAVSKLGIEHFRQWCDEGYKTVRYYDDMYSEWLTIPRSIKVTSVKPSGSVSLLAGATPGLHWPEARTYVRRMRLGLYSDLLPALRAANYPVEPAFGSEGDTVVVEIPVKIAEPIRTAAEVSLWEQLAMAAFMQRYWADNQVSATITFDPTTEGMQIASALNYYQYQLKGISFLPRHAEGAYRQMPYEAITEEEYHRRVAVLHPLHFDSHEDAKAEVFCSNDTCEIVTA